MSRIEGDQLSLFSLPPAAGAAPPAAGAAPPAAGAAPPPAAGAAPPLAAGAAGELPPRSVEELERQIMELAQRGDRTGIEQYLLQLMRGGKSQLVYWFCKLRPDFGLVVKDAKLYRLYRVGDKVRILSPGPLQGRIVSVEAVQPDKVVVRGKDWAIQRSYSFGSVRLVQRLRGGAGGAGDPGG